MASIEIALDIQSKILLDYEKAGILNSEIKEDSACRCPQTATLAFRRGVGRSAVRAVITSPG